MVQQQLATVVERLDQVILQGRATQVAVDRLRIESFPELGTQVALLDARTVSCPDVRVQVQALAGRRTWGRDLMVIGIAILAAGAAWAGVLARMVGR